MHPVVHDRLRDSRDVVATLRAGRQRAGRLVVVHVRPHDAASDPAATALAGDRARVAVLASRRVGQATERNRAKRLLREAARHVPLAGRQDVVLVARAACAGSNFAEVHREVWDLAATMGLLTAADEQDSTDRDASGFVPGYAHRWSAFEPRRTA